MERDRKRQSRDRKKESETDRPRDGVRERYRQRED